MEFNGMAEVGCFDVNRAIIGFNSLQRKSTSARTKALEKWKEDHPDIMKWYWFDPDTWLEQLQKASGRSEWYMAVTEMLEIVGYLDADSSVTYQKCYNDSSTKNNLQHLVGASNGEHIYVTPDQARFINKYGGVG